MKITNIYNLPPALVKACEDTYEPTADSYGATTLLKGVREILLTRRHWDEITQDVSDMVWMILGTAVHSLAERHDTTGQAETKFKAPMGARSQVTGVIDLYGDGVIEDYKTCSVWKVIFGDFTDWKRQGVIYTWLLRQYGIYIGKLRFHALIKDWNARDARFKPDYPPHSMWTWEYNVTTDDIKWADAWLLDKVSRIEAMVDLPDDELPQCSPDERWQTPTKYAAMKKGRKTALRVSESRDEVEGIGDYVEVREGEARKCRDYCPVRDICKYGREAQGQRTKEDI